MLWATGVIVVMLAVGSGASGAKIVVRTQTGIVAGAWRFDNGAEFPGARGTLAADKKGVLHLGYDFTGGGAYVAAYCNLATPAFLKAVSFRVRKPAEAQITVRITDSAGQTFQKALFYRHANWQPAVCGMRDWTAHWGGPDDGVVRQPISTIGVLLEGQGLKKPVGKVLIAALNAEQAGPQEKEDLAGGTYDGEYVVTDFGNDSGFACGPGAALRDGVLTADLKAVESVSLNHSLSLLGKPREFTLAASGPAGCALKLSIGSHFQSFDRVMGTLDGTEQTFTAPVPPEGWTHSGAEEGGLSYPLRVNAITVARGTRPAEPVSIHLRELRCKTRASRSALVTLLSQVGETAAAGETRTLTARCRAWNLLDTPLTGALVMTARDWENTVLQQQTATWTLPARGDRTDYAWDITIPARLNFADIEFRFEPQGAPVATTRVGFARPLDDAGDPALRPQSPWGMGLYLYRYGDNPEGYARMDRAAALAQAAGVKWSREEFGWNAIERQRGAYDFHFYDVVVDTALRHGISIYGLLAYWSEWTQPYTEQGIDDFSRWARAVVRRYKDRIKCWEIYNEPNIFFWSGPKELYPVLVTKCYAAIKEEDPGARVLAVSTAGIDRGFIKRVIDAGAPFDVLTVHPYRPRLFEKNFIREMKGVADLVGGRPVWITEMGWSTQVGGTDERGQAQLLARSYLAAVASGACQNISWYDFRNDGLDPFYNEANFGVLREDLSPKPAYRALATVCRTLENGEPHAVKRTGSSVLSLKMDDALALWTSEQTATVTCRVGKGALRALNLMGEEITPRRNCRRIVLTLEPGCPVFLTGGPVRVLRTDEPRAKNETKEVVHF
jgi:hypothetical protein